MSETKLDPFTLEIIKNGLTNAAEEMFEITKRAAKSSVIYEVLDFSTAITDREGNVIAQSSGLPMFIGVFDFMVKSIKNVEFKDGDILIINDPYLCGTHLNDVGIIKPIFMNGALIAYAINRAHWNDVGGCHFGSYSPSAEEIFQEGLTIPPVKIYNEGKLNKGVLDIILSNTRIPDYISGDLMAQISSLNLADERIKQILSKYDASIDEVAERIVANGEAKAEELLMKIPEFRVSASNLLDNGLKVSVEVILKHHSNRSTLEMRFFDLPEAQRESINTTYPGAVAAARTVYMNLLDPHTEYNQGVVLPLKVEIDRNTIFSAERPNPVSVYWESTTYASDTIWKALAKKFPEKFSAGHFLTIAAMLIAGTDARGENFVFVEPNAGGWGATEASDGESALVSLSDGETYITSVEIIDKNFPISIEKYELNTEDGTGPGEFRGGFGIVKAYKVLRDCEMTVALNRFKYPAWGLPKEGTVSYLKINNKKYGNVTSFKLKKGEVVEIHTGGGGGFGDPLKRDRKSVLMDIRNEMISTRTAKGEYGVDLSKDA